MSRNVLQLLARIVYRDEQEANRSRERCYCNAEEEENVYVYYSLLTFPEGEKLGYVFYSTVTEFINCLTILTNLLTIIFFILFDRWLKQRWMKHSL